MEQHDPATEAVTHVEPLSSTQHTAVAAEPAGSATQLAVAGTALPVHMEAKNPWSGLVTGPLVRKRCGRRLQ